eukprot:6297985-Alexandrium_andersonii.AAC.1
MRLILCNGAPDLLQLSALSGTAVTPSDRSALHRRGLACPGHPEERLWRAECAHPGVARSGGPK